MKTLLLVVLIPLILGAIGYGVGTFLAPKPTPAPGKIAESPREILYKLPLGRFTVQIMHPRRLVHIQFNMDVYVAGAGDFEAINGLQGRTKLRDAVIAVVSDLAEGTLWAVDSRDSEIDQEDLARQIVLGIYPDFPMVRSARIEGLSSALSARN